MPVKYLFNNT